MSALAARSLSSYAVVSTSAAAMALRACCSAPEVRARRSLSICGLPAPTGGDGVARLLQPPRGTRPPLSQNAVERTANEKTVGRHQQDEQDHRRHGAEHKFTELIQYLVHEWGRLVPLGSPVVSCLTQLDCGAGNAGEDGV